MLVANMTRRLITRTRLGLQDCVLGLKIFYGYKLMFSYNKNTKFHNNFTCLRKQIVYPLPQIMQVTPMDLTETTTTTSPPGQHRTTTT